MRTFFTIMISYFCLSVTTARAQEVKGYEIDYKDSVEQTLLIPNAFTPNNDGRNDVFKIINFTNQKLVEFRVFNRWGTILFQTQNPQDGWDGTYKGKKQPTGIYGYIIRVAYPDNVVETYKGRVTLIR